MTLTLPRRQLASLTPRQQLRSGRMPRRLVQLFIGLTFFGASMGMMVRARLGTAPWDVLHWGLTSRLPLSFGTIVIIVGALVLLAWWPLRQWPGLGTVCNVVWVGVASDATLAVLDPPEALGWRIALMVGGVVLNGVASAMYIGSQLGPGPRDGLMTGLAQRTGRSIRLVRTSLEVVVLASGWVLGGVVGVGTVLYATAIGPLIQLFLPLLIVDLGERGRYAAGPGDGEPAGSAS
ncbi:MAG TPA: hypothetical protein VFJ12_11490 [Segeticoccus sp.]|jgi:uncharacterized membrane protein YczE|nr:hypothetical protein [Segeticoccus sp.]